MKPIQFEHIPDVGMTLQENFTAARVSELLQEPGRELFYTGVKAADVRFHLERKGSNAQVAGEGFFALSHPCVRCLEPVSVDFELNFNTELEKPKTINLEELLTEELFLELPNYPACEPTCETAQ